MAELVSRYRKKPVVIDASAPISPTTADDIAAWCGGKVIRDVKPSDPDDVYVAVVIPTLEGPMTGPVGWRVIRGVKGEFYPCASDVFEATYEHAGDEEAPRG